MYRPLLIALLLIAPACGGDDGVIAELSDDSLVEVCQSFHDRVCSGEPWRNCTPACRATCDTDQGRALMREHCVSPITVEAAYECADLYGAGDESARAVCLMGGGCVFDVFDETCP